MRKIFTLNQRAQSAVCSSQKSCEELHIQHAWKPHSQRENAALIRVNHASQSDLIPLDIEAVSILLFKQSKTQSPKISMDFYTTMTIVGLYAGLYTFTVKYVFLHLPNITKTTAHPLKAADFAFLVQDSAVHHLHSRLKTRPLLFLFFML